MNWKSVYTDKLSSPSGVFAHATQVDFGFARMTFTSGMVSRNADGSVHAPGDIELQTRRVLQSLEDVLSEAGCNGLRDAISMMVHVIDVGEFAAIHRVRREFFPTNQLPASTMVEVRQLVDKDFLIEISAVAYTVINSDEES